MVAAGIIVGSALVHQIQFLALYTPFAFGSAVPLGPICSLLPLVSVVVAVSLAVEFLAVLMEVALLGTVVAVDEV